MAAPTRSWTARTADVTSPALVAGGLALVAVVVTQFALLSAGDATAMVSLLALLAAGVWILARPAWLVPAFVALTWSAVGAGTFGGSASPVQAGAILLLAVVAWRMAREPRRAVAPLLVAALLGAGLVSTAIFDGGSLPTGETLTDLGFVLIPALLLSRVIDVERMAVALTVLAVVLGAGAAYSVLVHPTALFPVVTEEGLAGAAGVSRAAGPFGEPNFFALSLAALLPLCLWVAGRAGQARLLGLVAAAAVVAGVLATGSRGGLVAVAVAAAGTALLARGGTGRRLPIVVVVGLLILLPVFATQVGGSESRTVSGRATENEIAVAMFTDHPLTGVGPAQFPVHYRDYGRQLGNDPRSGREPHSLPLQIAAEQGVVGLLAWAAALLLVLRCVLRGGVLRTGVGRATFLALITYLAGSLFLHGSQLRLPYMLIGALLALAACTPAAAGHASDRPERAT